MNREKAKQKLKDSRNKRYIVDANVSEGIIRTEDHNSLVLKTQTTYKMLIIFTIHYLKT